MAEQFCTPRSTRRRAVRLDEQHKDDVDEHVAKAGHVEEVQGQTVIDPIEVVKMDVARITDEVVEMDAIHIDDEVLDTYEVLLLMRPRQLMSRLLLLLMLLLRSHLYTLIEFLGGPSGRSVFIEYVDHVAYRLWQGEVYI